MIIIMTVVIINSISRKDQFPTGLSCLHKKFSPAGRKLFRAHYAEGESKEKKVGRALNWKSVNIIEGAFGEF